MSSNEDEQLQEVEALEAIYPDEFTVLTQEPLEWNIKIVPHPDGSEENHGEQGEERGRACWLACWLATTASFICSLGSELARCSDVPSVDLCTPLMSSCTVLVLNSQRPPLLSTGRNISGHYAGGAKVGHGQWLGAKAGTTISFRMLHY
jgi:hypothetical protein